MDELVDNIPACKRERVHIEILSCIIRNDRKNVFGTTAYRQNYYVTARRTDDPKEVI